GTFSHGQGHATTYAQMVSEWLGVPFENIRLVQGDTSQVSFGRGTYASRSVMIGGSALKAAADALVDKARPLAAHPMEAAPADVGRVINPLICKGQLQGGLAQGIGQALFEQIAYDRESGQLLSGTFADYCMPRADDLPPFDLDFHEVLCRTNPIGVKGVGEAG